jgi:hypothetical protein
MISSVLTRAFVVCLLACVPSFANLLQITFNGNLTPANQGLSNMIFVYQGSDGGFVYQLSVPVFPSVNPCQPNCTFQASGEAFAPDGWSPTVYSKYMIIGVYGANAGLFIVAPPSANLNGADFDTTFGSSPGEATLLQSAGGPLPWGFGASTQAKAFLNNNLAYGISVPLVPNGNPVQAGNGKIWNFTSGVENGTVSVSATIAAVPEPSSVLLAATGLIILLRRARA